MDNKTKAESLRAMADHFDEIAKISNDIEDSKSASHYRNIAEHLREQVDKIDPPQPEWQYGDLALDREGDIWQFDGDDWWFQREANPTEVLIARFGPLTRVLTYDPAKQRTTDPAKQEVVVSVAGMPREPFAYWAETTSLSFTGQTAIRLAKAVREQLGEVQQ